MTAKEYTSTIDGLRCQTLPGSASGKYPVIFRRQDATLEQIEAIHWDKPTLGGAFNTLPKGYGFDLKNIEYTSCDSSYHVTVQAQEQYWGDVTVLNKQVETLEGEKAELEADVKAKEGEIQKAGEALEEKTAEVEAKAAQVIGLTAAVTQVAAISTELPDDLALSVQDAAPNAFPRWEDVLAAARELPKGRVIDDGGQLYRVEQTVVPQAHQAPHDEGMLAIYRPITVSHAGTAEDPIPWVYGMDCEAGKYYTYNGDTYKVAEGGDMKPCVWTPDSGIWQWEKVEG